MCTEKVKVIGHQMMRLETKLKLERRGSQCRTKDLIREPQDGVEVALMRHIQATLGHLAREERGWGRVGGEDGLLLRLDGCHGVSGTMTQKRVF